MVRCDLRRTLRFQSNTKIGVICGNKSTYYANYWLKLIGNPPFDNTDICEIIIIDGVSEKKAREEHPNSQVIINLWDYQVGHKGTGVHASAVSGAAATIGYVNGPGVPLPSDIPEKWCGAYGVILALAEVWRREYSNQGIKISYDVSSADIMRSFALQNAGDKTEMSTRWRRNGQICVEHGGIFPMGFYPCKDGHVALLGRSRRDWDNIRSAIGNPEWAFEKGFNDPFILAKNSAKADKLLSKTLTQYTRDQLLKRGLNSEAIIAPVYQQQEAMERQIFRKDFFASGTPAMPFSVHNNKTEPLSSQKRKDRYLKSESQMPLEGLRCIELSWVWSGPMVGQILGDLGAEVIKVENHNRFDLYRTRGLETLRGKMNETVRIESSLYFHSLNRNKLGLSLDLKKPDELETLKNLAKSSDILIENFTVGTIERLGLGAKDLAKINPLLLHLSMSGPGRGSSVENLRSYGLVLSALGGAEAEITDENGFLGSPTFSLSDPNAAIFGVIGALSGAIRSKIHGFGGSLDLSQIEASATLTGAPTQRKTRFETILKTRDGVFVAISIPKTHFDTGAKATANLSKITRDELISLCTELGGEAVDLIELVDSDKSDIFSQCPGHILSTHPYTGTEKLVSAPWRINGIRPHPRKPAPVLGESNDYVLHSLVRENNTKPSTSQRG